MMKNRHRLSWKRLFPFVISGLLAIGGCRGAIETIVLLDQASFPAHRHRDMQHLAAEVALSVDQLIPGQVESYPRSGILCFVAREDFPQPTPITLVGAREPGEPVGTAANSVRIALNPQVLQSSYDGDPEFIFELAHELAHVKMDARFDHYLDETFATAVSLKLLTSFGFSQYREDTLTKYLVKTNALPPSVRLAISRRDWESVARYWQSQIKVQTSKQPAHWNIPFLVLGSLILEAAQKTSWSQFLGIGAIAENCYLQDGTPIEIPDPAMRFKVCLPDIKQMKKLNPTLKVLGFP